MEERTELSALGEFGLIKHLTQNHKLKNSESIKGIGDDAAVLDAQGKKVLLSTDMLVEGVHFDLSYVPLKHLGYKSAVVNFSDIYAMNATPKQITVSLAISSRFSVEALEEFYEGLYVACEKYGVDVVGGDTTSSLSGLVISVSVIGYANENEIVYRNTAQVGDLICVSGDLGAAYMGLQLLEREKQIFLENPEIQPDLSAYDYVLERQLKPEARRNIISKLQEKKVVPTAMIDVSDGLASEIIHICTQSKSGCKLYENKFPVDPQTINAIEEMNLDTGIVVLNGGEDYELLFTVNPKDLDAINTIEELSIIGHITDASEGMYYITHSDTAIQLTAQGWDAFLNKK
jgi:thiamine-monophosphate kinase